MSDGKLVQLALSSALQSERNLKSLLHKKGTGQGHEALGTFDTDALAL